MKMRCFLFFCAVLMMLLFSCSNGVQHPEISVADRVEVVSYKTPQECNSKGLLLIPMSWDTIPERCIREKVVLNSNQLVQLKEILFDNALMNEECKLKMCYSPKHAVFFYKNERVIAYVEISFECNQSRGLEIGCLTEDRTTEIQHFFRELGIKYGLRD